MVRSVRPECVYICTPPGTHAELVSHVLDEEAPRAIFVEKPLATSARDASALTDSAQKRKVVGMVGFQRRFNSVFREAKKILARGDIGDVVFFRAHTFTSSVLSRQSSGWRLDPKSGGVVLEWGIHLIDLILWIFGRPESVTAFRRRIFSERVEDYASVSLSFPQGVSGLVEVGWSMRNYDPPEFGIEIHGSAGMLDLTEDRVVIYRATDASNGIGGRAHPVLIHASELDPHPPFLIGQPENVWQEEHFQQGIASGAVSVNAFAESIAVHEVVDRIRSAPLR
jgi:predicted dehydrogenase